MTTSDMLRLDPTTTALVLVDLQNGVVNMPLAPHTGSEVVSAANELAKRFRARGSSVVLVTLDYPAGEQPPETDVGMPPLPAEMPEGWDSVVDGIEGDPADIRVVKPGWGAFFGTNLDDTLRARGVNTIVIGGIATNFGVEETGRQAVNRGYSIVFASDAMTSVSPQHHQFAVENILPMIGRVRSTAALI